MKAEDFLDQGTKPVDKKITPRGMSAEAFLDMPVEEPIGEPAVAGPAFVQGQPPTMLERGKEAVTGFFRPSFAPEPTVPVGMEGMPEPAIPAGMSMDIPVRRAEIDERLGQLDVELQASAKVVPPSFNASDSNIKNLQAQLEDITSQAVDGALPPDLYEQYTALRPQYEKALEDYNALINTFNSTDKARVDAHNAKVAEAQGLTGELEDLKQMEYGAEMTRPISTITGKPVPLPRRLAQIFPEEQKQVLPALRKGLAHGLTGLAGTVGTGLEYAGTRTGLEPLKEIGKTTREYWEEKGKGLGPTPYIQGAILEKPELMTRGAWWAYNLADMTPSFAAMMIPGIGAARHIKLAGQALKLTPKVIERLSRIGALTTAGAVGGGMEGAGTYQEILDRGGSDEDAAAGMEAMTLAAGALNSIGFSKITGKLGAKKSNALMRFLKAGSWEGLTEYLEEPAEILIKRGILPDTAFNKDAAIKQLKQGVNVIPIAGVMGGTTSAITGRVISEPEISPTVPPGVPPAPTAPGLSETQRELAKEVIREKMAEQPLPPAIPGMQIPFVPPGMPAPVAPAPAGPAPSMLPSGQEFGLIEPEPETRSREAFEKFVEKTGYKFRSEEIGQDILDTLEEIKVSPQEVSNRFWEEIYPDLSTKLQKKFESQLNGLTGMKPGDPLATKNGKTIYSKSWQEIAKDFLPNKIEYLEGPERGYVALMTDAVNRFATKEFEGVEYVAGRPTPEELVVEYKPILGPHGLPWKEKERALKAFGSKRLKDMGITEETHEVVPVKNGFGVARKAVEVPPVKEEIPIEPKKPAVKPEPKKPEVRVAPKKEPVVEIAGEGQIYKMTSAKAVKYENTDLFLSPELEQLHNHRARVLGFEKAGGSFVEGYLTKLAEVAEKTDMPAAMAAYRALSEYKKGNVTQATLDAEKILGKLHEKEVKALTHDRIIELHKQDIRKALKSGELTPEKYAELHEKDYGPLGEFMPEATKAPPEVPEIKEIPEAPKVLEIPEKVVKPVPEMPEVKKAEVEKSFEPDLAAMPLEKITVETKALREATREMVTTKENAKKALARIDDEIAKYKKLLECL